MISLETLLGVSLLKQEADHLANSGDLGLSENGRRFASLASSILELFGAYATLHNAIKTGNTAVLTELPNFSVPQPVTSVVEQPAPQPVAQSGQQQIVQEQPQPTNGVITLDPGHPLFPAVQAALNATTQAN